MQSGEQTCFLQPSPQQTLPVAHLPPEQGAAAHRPVLALQAVNEGQKPPDCLRQSGLQCLAVTSQMKSGRSQAIVSPHTGKAAVLAPELLNTGTHNRGGRLRNRQSARSTVNLRAHAAHTHCCACEVACTEVAAHTSTARVTNRC